METTHYLADFELTTLVRPVLDRKRRKVFDPFWLGSGHEAGLGLFVSALDAEIYRQMLLKRGEHWLRLPLDRFDLLDHIRDFDGRLQCEVVFGFSATLGGKLAVKRGLPRPYLVPFNFTIQGDPAPPVTFHFPSEVFAFIREQWAMLGVRGHADDIQRTNEVTDLQLADAAVYALSAIEHEDAFEEQAHDWCVFSPMANTWRFGPDEPRQSGNLH